MEFDLYGFRGQERTFLIYGNGEAVVTALQNLGGNEELGFTNEKRTQVQTVWSLPPLESHNLYDEPIPFIGRWGLLMTGVWDPKSLSALALKICLQEPPTSVLTVHAIFCIDKWYPITGCMVFQPRQSVIHPGG